MARLSRDKVAANVAAAIVHEGERVDALRSEPGLFRPRDYAIQAERLAEAQGAIKALEVVFTQLTGEIPSITTVRQWANKAE